MVFTNPSAISIDAAVNYARSRGWTRFMVRHDARQGQPRSLQGGFLIDLDQIEPWLARFTHGGICMLLEPLDPLLNGYNVSCLFESMVGSLEIAGPGFDASDLQRGQITPHETLSWNLTTGQLGAAVICSDAAYAASLAERHRKIWWKFVKSEPDPKRWLDTGDEKTQAVQQVVSNIRGCPIPPKYKPIPEFLLDKYKKLASPVLTAWRKARGNGLAVLAGSYVQDGSFRFWDINIPARWIGDRTFSL